MTPPEPRGSYLCLRDAPVLVGVTALVTVVQSTCVSREFLLDDYLHLYQLATLDPWRFLLATYSGHVLVTFHAALAALHAAFGLDATGYYVAGLTTHALNVALLYVVVRGYASTAVAALAAGLWGITPVQFGVLSWVSAYAQMLATTCVLAALALLTHWLARRREPPGWALGACVLLMLMGAASYGMGIAIAFVFPAVAWLLAPPESRPARVGRWLAPLLLVPVAYLLLSRFVDPSPGNSSLPATVSLFGKFLGFGTGALVLGPLFAVTPDKIGGWPVAALRPETILWYGALLGLAMALVLVLTVRRADRTTTRAALAGVILMTAAYASVALGRFFMDVPLSWIVIRPRYHYLPLSGAALTLGVVASAWERRLGHRARRRFRACLALYAVAVVVGSFLVVRRMPNSVHLLSQGNAKRARDDLARAIGAAAPGAQVFIDNTAFNPVRLVRNVAGKSTRFPGLAAYFAIVYDRNTIAGHRVWFVEPDPKLVRDVRAGPSQRMRELLLATNEALGLRK